MKALTLTQPWATLVAISAKKIETRSWSTPYRGPLAIHAAKGFPLDARDFAGCRFVNHFLVTAGYATADRNAGLPTGCVVATCHLANCLPVEVVDNSRNVWGVSLPPLSEQERAFGNYDRGRFAWILEDIKPLPEPLPARGAFGLWEWEPPQEVRDSLEGNQNLPAQGSEPERKDGG
jgi:hypothetical protein